MLTTPCHIYRQWATFMKPPEFLCLILLFNCILYVFILFYYNYFINLYYCHIFYFFSWRRQITCGHFPALQADSLTHTRGYHRRTRNVLVKTLWEYVYFINLKYLIWTSHAHWHWIRFRHMHVTVLTLSRSIFSSLPHMNTRKHMDM